RGSPVFTETSFICRRSAFIRVVNWPPYRAVSRVTWACERLLMPQVGLCELEAGLALAAFAGESGRSGRNRITSCLRTTRPESSGSEGRDTTAGMEGQPRKCWASLRSVCRTKVAEESCGHPSCFLGQCDLPGGGRGLWNWLGVLPYYNDSSVTAPPAAALHLVEIAIGRFQ